MKKLVVGWLVWLTQENLSRRLKMVETSAESLSILNGDAYDVIAINNDGLDPLPLTLSSNVEVLHTGKNFIDISAAYFSYLTALSRGYSYFAFTYDDFVVYKDSLVDCIDYMDAHPEVSCMRLPYYKTGDVGFDSAITPKLKNPDAVNHTIGAGDSIRRTTFKRGEKTRVGDNTFYKCNWRPNSRPTLWRTDSFSKFASLEDARHPVMQPFEARMYDIADKLSVEGKFESAYLEGGMCKTFPVETSERTRSELTYWDSYSIDMKELCRCYEDQNSWRSHHA